jgi:predicted nucleotidyltransferase
MTDQAMARLLAERLVAELRPRRIVWFGSRAAGKGRPDSDFDFLVVADTSLAPGERMFRAQRAIRDLPVAADIIVLTPAEHARYSTWKSSVVHDANQSGQVLFEADSGS